MNLEALTCYDWIDVMAQVTAAIKDAMNMTGYEKLQEPLLQLLTTVFNGIITKCTIIPGTT